MRTVLTIIICLVAATVSGQRKQWSFSVSCGAGINAYVPMSQFEKEFMSHPDIVSRPWIDRVPWEDNSEHTIVPDIAIGASYTAEERLRLSLQTGSQNLRQEYYHASVFYIDALVGYDMLKSERHDLYVEAGIGSYNTFNRFSYNWTGISSETGKVLEQINVDLGHHNSFNWAVPIRCCYAYNISESFSIGASLGMHYIVVHSSYAPIRTASLSICLSYKL